MMTIKNLNVFAAETVILNNIWCSIPTGKITAFVGGSGSGKTTLALSLLRLSTSGLSIKSGEINFKGTDLLKLSEDQMRKYRGKEIGMIFQEPLHAFDPLFTIGQQIDEVLVSHTQLNKDERKEKALEALAQVELEDPKRVYASYPHQLSGGMRQRAMIAQAIACRPELLIADEATSNLDVSLQVKIMSLLRKLNKELGMTIILIAHDLGVVSHLADEVIILKKGEVVENGSVTEVMKKPKHSYTKQLIEAF